MATTTTASPGLPPTTQLYHDLQLAYEFFKVELFAVELPPCLITLQRKGSGTRGYFSAARFAKMEGTVADEIALNPRHFKNRTFIEVMSTLVHEMVHQWQHHFGRCRSRSAYHNKEWAGEMLRIGLHPSSTGEPGGRMTGQAMTHYVMPNGRFEIAAIKLKAMLPAIAWFDADAAITLPRGLADVGLVVPAQRLSGRWTVYRCSGCGLRAESRSNVFIICGICERQMDPVGLR